MERTADHLLSGRVRYAQPRDGFRSGIEPVLLAAAVPARAGQRVLEGGSGAGAGLLCLAARVPGVEGFGVEQDAALARLAGENAAANGLSGLRFAPGTMEAIPGDDTFDHAFANPPYHGLGGTRPATAARDCAKHAAPDALAAWIGWLAARLRSRGTLTIVAPAARVPDCLAGFHAAGCGSAALLPLWPREGRGAKLALVQGIKHGKGPFQLLPGLILHTPSGCFTPAAEAVLRDGEPLRLLAPAVAAKAARSPDAADTKAVHAPRPGFPCSAGAFRPG